MTDSPRTVNHTVVLALASVIVLSGLAGVGGHVAVRPAAASATGGQHTGGTAGGGVLASTAASVDCGTGVVYDSFRDDNATVDTLQNGTNVTQRKQLTSVTVGNSNGFHRVRAENPNGYCVQFTVQIHGDVFPPADIPGKVESTDGEHLANWTSVYDWDTETLYTEITFTLPANSTAMFAPASARVVTLSWAERKPKESKGILEKQLDRFTDNETVEQKEHIIKAQDIDRTTPFEVVVPLEHPETGERLKDKTLVYSTDGGDSWRPVDTRTDAPVYKRDAQNGSALKLTFNDKDVRVKFIANPDTSDDVAVGYATWQTGVYDTIDAFIPGDQFSVTRKDAKSSDDEES